MPRLSRETILSYFLAFVVLWFGANEVMDPGSWAGYLPAFLSASDMANTLVVFHGVVLVISGLSLIFNFYRRAGASVIVLMLLAIIFTLISGGGLNEIAVRDIGLLGMALALAIRN